MPHYIDEQQSLDIAAARALLREHGYELVCRFEHVHALKDNAELHICLIAELTTMQPHQFLMYLNEAIRLSLQYRLPLLGQSGKRSV